jgi:hypothetical protein
MSPQASGVIRQGGYDEECFRHGGGDRRPPLMAGFSSVTGSAAGEPRPFAQADNLPLVMPMDQELPFDRYWSKD